MECGLGEFLGVEGLDTRFYGEIRGKNLRERAELEVDPPFARPPQRAKTARRGPRTTPASQDRSPGTPGSQRRTGHPLLMEDQDSKNLGGPPALVVYRLEGRLYL